MSENTKIEWCDHTFNPWIGCTQVGPGCDNCYAKAFDRRFAVSGHAMHWGAGVARKRTGDANWRLPLKWDRAAEANGTRPKVFCASLADVFDNKVPENWRADLFSVIATTPNIDWLLLTKRIGNAQGMIAEAMCTLDKARMGLPAAYKGVSTKWPLQNVWLGATIVNQTEADRDIPKLLAVPAHKRFLSMEPLLGTVDLTKWIGQQPAIGATTYRDDKDIYRCDLTGTPVDGIDWVIVGGESGPNARPMHPGWVRSLRDQCEAAGVPFLFKQWGEWKPISQMEEADHIRLYKSNVKALPHEDQCNMDDIYGRTCTVPYTVLHLDGSTHGISEPNAFIVGAMQTFKIGKKAAGRLLDGREWNGVPA